MGLIQWFREKRRYRAARAEIRAMLEDAANGKPFAQMRKTCPQCGGELQISVRPDGTVFTLECLEVIRRVSALVASGIVNERDLKRAKCPVGPPTTVVRKPPDWKDFIRGQWFSDAAEKTSPTVSQ